MRAYSAETKKSRLMSLGIHRIWKRIALQLSHVRYGEKVLDLAGGTGDMTALFRERVGEKGLVVLSGCGHAGIVNTARQAMEVSGVKKIHAVLGGFHLFPAPDDYLRNTVEAMRKLDPDVIIPMHCSGPGLIAILRSEVSDKVVTSTTGTEFVFGA